MEIVILVLLIVLNGLFAMSEIALVTARRARLAKRVEEGDQSAAIAIKLGEDPTRFLSTIQIGITSIGILNGIVGEAALAAPLALWLQELGVDREASELGSTVLVVVIITYLSIVVGELVPKRIGQLHPEAIARVVARPMNILAAAARPFVHLLVSSTAMLMRLLRQHDTGGDSITEEEIHAMLDEGSQSGVIEKSEHEMVRNVFRLDDRRIGSFMVPVSELVWLDVTKSWEENLALIAESGHSRYPVCRGGLHDILGVVGTKQLVGKALQGTAVSLGENLEPAVYVTNWLSCMELLHKFRAHHCRLVFVVDEYGDVQGLVTLNDVLESVTGDFHPETSEESWAFQREDGSWLLDGLIPLQDLKDCLAIKTVPGDDKARYHTLSGMIMWLLGRVPHIGDIAVWECWRLEVVDLDGKRVDKVLAVRIKDGECGGAPLPYEGLGDGPPQ